MSEDPILVSLFGSETIKLAQQLDIADLQVNDEMARAIAAGVNELKKRRGSPGAQTPVVVHVGHRHGACGEAAVTCRQGRASIEKAVHDRCQRGWIFQVDQVAGVPDFKLFQLLYAGNTVFAPPLPVVPVTER